MDIQRKKKAISGFSNQLSVYGQVYLTIQINSFLYYCSRLPVLGKFISHSWYSRYRTKKLWSLFGLVFGAVKSAFANNIGTLILIYVLPHLFLQEEQVTPGVFLMLFLLIKCISAALIECALFKTTPEDYTFLNHFMVNPLSYYRYKAVKSSILSNLLLFPAVYFLFRDWPMTAVLILCKLFCGLFGNVAYLEIYRKTGRLPGKQIRTVLAFGVILVSYGGAFLKWYQGAAISPGWQAAVIAVYSISSVFCWIYHLRYSDYKKIAVKFANQSVMSLQVSIKSNSVGEAETGLLESDWETNREFFRTYRDKAPETYLDLAFTRRFGKTLRRERRDQILGLLFIGAVLGLGIRFGWLPVTSDTVLDYSPVLIAFSTALSFSGRLMQLYFRNIDMHLLSRHMATPDFIRSSMVRRYLYVLKTGILSAAAIGTNLGLMLFLSGLTLPSDTIVRLMAVCILFLFFQETYECIVYYMIQPYSTDFTAKSPVFRILGYVEGIFYLLILFVRRDLTAALPWVCAACVGAVVLFFLCRKFAPKTFRLR